MKNNKKYILGIRICNGKVYENIKLNNKTIYLKLCKDSYIINDTMIEYFDLFNLKVNEINSEITYVYDGYINYEIKEEVLLIIKRKNEVRFFFSKSYFFEHVFRRKYKLKFYDSCKRSIYKHPKDTRKKDIFFNIGFNLYNLPYYINLSKRNYGEKIKIDLKNKLLNNKDIINNSIIVNEKIDLIPIYFKNEALYLSKDNYDMVSSLENTIYRQENNFFILTKDLHELVNENNIFLDKLEFFNYYDVDCFMEEGIKEIIFEGKIKINNKNKFDILNENIEKICKNLNIDNKNMRDRIKDIIIPTEINNETIFASNVRLIFEEIIKIVIDSDVLKKIRDNLSDYKYSKNEPPEVMNKYLAQITGKDVKNFHSVINPIKNFRNMYSHNKGSYKKNYEENYKFVRKGEFNKYNLNEDPQKNNFNFLSHKIIEDVNSFLETINIYFKNKH